jgi:hypothetical protein
MASDCHGCSSSGLSLRRRTSPLLGYLHPSYGTRDQLHFRRYRCSWRPLFFDLCLYVPTQSLRSRLTIAVFQAELNILGMIIYGCELALWTGVVICGGYFNLVPWTKSRLNSRKQHIENERQLQVQANTTGSITLHQMPSSTSVFRTPSSLMVERNGGG